VVQSISGLSTKVEVKWYPRWFLGRRFLPNLEPLILLEITGLYLRTAQYYIINTVLDLSWGRLQFVDQLSTFVDWQPTVPEDTDPKKQKATLKKTQQNRPEEVPAVLPPSLAAKVARPQARSLCLFPCSRALALSFSLFSWSIVSWLHFLWDFAVQ
jgi:hypothetical protein